MEFITVEMLTGMLDTKTLTTVGIIYFIFEKRAESKFQKWIGPFKQGVTDHAKSVQESLSSINANIGQLKDSIVKLEETQTKKINDLGERVTRLETKKGE